MEKIKSYTDLEQSKMLAEILPLESADMYYSNHFLENYYSPIPNIGNYSAMHNQIPCWSASALLEIIRNNGRYELQMYEGGYYFEANGFMTESYFNLVDACVEMILHIMTYTTLLCSLDTHTR